ncbi:exported hypothetical protein [Mesorhizobium plurifarium]|uniref:Uncharacterized protein n=1 Tax=Mesorhizobium plurifarium TaxID=69974 RepID=A0A0K2VTN2_MESPL|nr:exported hypothetical protein [Mesorhizobium plurifarium]
MKFGTEIVLLSLFAFALLLAASLGVDEAFRLHMSVLSLAAAGFTAFLLRNTEFKPAAPNACLIVPGVKVFADNYVAPHNESAKGNREFGAPDLIDAIWLHGPGETLMAAQVRTRKKGAMPKERLGEIKVKKLASYVHSLGIGE